MRSKRDSRRPSATVARGIRQVQLGNDGDIADWRRSGLFDGLYFNLSGALIEETYSIGTMVMLSSDGNVYPITQRDLDLGNVDIGTDDPLQQVLDGMECRGAMWFWRPVIYTIGTAEMAALAAATAAGLGAGSGTLTRLELSEANSIGSSFSSAQLSHFRRILAQGGRRALERSLRKLERRLAEHLADKAAYEAAGGYTSVTIREIANFEAEIKAIKFILNTLP
ncbi:MAG: hypothetical protein JSS77_07915 [Acidobacteria bacterium]|nr:hypothetical protein [Acidobacteriota bacterium]